jgi:hypothetical protein
MMPSFLGKLSPIKMALELIFAIFIRTEQMEKRAYLEISFHLTQIFKSSRLHVQDDTNRVATSLNE